MRDYYKTLGDLFMDNFYGKLRELCHGEGLRWHSESGGPWNRKRPTFRHADQLAFLGRNDMPQGEQRGFRGRKTQHLHERGFARAQVAGAEELLAAGGMQELHHQGRLRTEGRDYRVADGDVIEFLFT